MATNVLVKGLAMTDQLERNKKTVMAFYDLMFNQCQPAKAIKRYAGDVYNAAQSGGG